MRRSMSWRALLLDKCDAFVFENDTLYSKRAQGGLTLSSERETIVKILRTPDNGSSKCQNLALTVLIVPESGLDCLNYARICP